MEPTKQEMYERRVRWARALPDHDQTAGALTKLDHETYEPIGHCCLGVACELAVADGRLVSSVASGHLYYGLRGESPPGPDTYLVEDGMQATVLPRSEAEYLGLRDEAGTFAVRSLVGGLSCNGLTAANDNRVSFKDIGAFIETQAGKALRGKPQVLFAS